MRDWAHGTPEDDWVSMSIPSDGSYGVKEGIIYSFPVTVENGSYKIVQGLDNSEFVQEKMKATEEELVGERDAVKHLI